jgi:hypothetical protein
MAFCGLLWDFSRNPKETFASAGTLRKLNQTGGAGIDAMAAVSTPMVER